MTTRMVAPEPDMLSAVVHGLVYEIHKDDRFGRVVDVNDIHVNDFRAMGFVLPSELEPQEPIDLTPSPSNSDEDAERSAAEATEKEKLEAEQAEQDRLVAEAKAKEEADAKAKEEAEAAAKAEADKAAADSADASEAAPKKGKSK